MRYLCKFFLILFSFHVTADLDDDFIHPIYANNYIGQVKVVCGKAKGHIDED